MLLYDTQRVLKRAELTPYYAQQQSMYGEQQVQQYDPVNACVVLPVVL